MTLQRHLARFLEGDLNHSTVSIADKTSTAQGGQEALDQVYHDLPFYVARRNEVATVDASYHQDTPNEHVSAT